VTTLVHGAVATNRASNQSSALFNEDLAALSFQEALALFSDVPSIDLAAAAVYPEGISVVDLVTHAKLAPSKSEARRLVESGGISVNDQRIVDPKFRITRDHAIGGGQLFIVKKGPRHKHLVRLT
jgi:tyrosyl-tRNA synthetase